MKIIGIYKITNKINGSMYIGQSVDCLRRIREHFYKAFYLKKEENINKKFYKAIRSFGKENFTWEIIEECQENELLKREEYWIKKYNTYYNESHYNDTIGGENSGRSNIHKGEEHGMAIFSLDEVKFCRREYEKGSIAKNIWSEYFSDRISFNSFQKMWHGYTWKDVLPESLLKNPRPSKKVTKEIAKDIINRYKQGEKLSSIQKSYKGILGATTVHDVAKEKRKY